jgi:hypothetical protein
VSCPSSEALDIGQLGPASPSAGPIVVPDMIAMDPLFYVLLTEEQQDQLLKDMHADREETEIEFEKVFQSAVETVEVDRSRYLDLLENHIDDVTKVFAEEHFGRVPDADELYEDLNDELQVLQLEFDKIRAADYRPGRSSGNQVFRVLENRISSIREGLKVLAARKFDDQLGSLL